MMLCIATGGHVEAMALSLFVLSWTHSVEKTEWQEKWMVSDAGFEILAARVKSSGAGMEPGEGARRIGDWWEWHPELPVQRELVLANSGSTISGWRICGSGKCTDISQEFTGTVRLYPCAAALD